MPCCSPQLASAYAPESHLRGVAVAAPATALDALLRDDADSDEGRNITAMTLRSWHRVFGLPLDDVLQPRARQAMDALSRECIESAYDLVERKWSGREFKQHFLAVFAWIAINHGDTPRLSSPTRVGNAGDHTGRASNVRRGTAAAHRPAPGSRTIVGRPVPTVD